MLRQSLLSVNGRAFRFKKCTCATSRVARKLLPDEVWLVVDESCPHHGHKDRPG